jgi:hypothetical protein
MIQLTGYKSKRATDGLNVAVILAGQVRTMSYCLPRLQESFDGLHKTSFFLSTWDKNEQSAHHGVTNSSNIYRSTETGPAVITSEYLDKEEFGFSGFCIEEYEAVTAKHLRVAEETLSKIPFDLKEKAHPDELEAKAFMIALNQLHLLKSGYALVKGAEKANDQKFDIVVRARPDIIFTNPIVWPAPGEIVTDCLRLSRRRKHFAFDGYFAGAPDDVEPLLNGYDAYFELLNRNIYFDPYISKLSILWPFAKTSHRRRMGSNGRHSVIRSERFYRYLLSKQKGCEIIDTRVCAKIVRLGQAKLGL